MSSITPAGQDALSEATWTSIIDALRQDQLQSLLEQHSSDEVLTALKKSGLGARASSMEILTELQKLPDSWEDLVLLQILLAAAAVDGDSDLFKIYAERCSSNGIHVLYRLQSLVYKVPEVFIFLAHLDWKSLGSDRSAAKSFISAALQPHPTAEWPMPLRFLFRTNGIPSEDDWKELALNAPDPELLGYLLKFNPAGILNYGMLQHLAGGGYEPDVVKKLISAGADVNLDPPVYQKNDLGEGGRPWRPLWTIAFYSRFWGPSESVKLKWDAAKLLLDNGANVRLAAHDCGDWKSALQTVREAGNLELIELYERYQDRYPGGAET